MRRFGCGALTLGLLPALSPFVSRAAPAGTAFTYQGRLKLNGSPMNGTANVRFTLWDAAANGNMIGSFVDVNNVPVADGLFNVALDFGPAASVIFNGEARWLQVVVNGQTLAPRQPITAAPYALRSLQIDSLALPYDGEGTHSPIEALFRVRSLNTSQSGNTAIFQSNSTADNSRAVTGLASGNSGQTYGVYGDANSPAGIGVYGEGQGTGVFGKSTAASGSHAGVRGETNSPAGYAGYFVGGRNYFSGNVGVGTSEPAVRLHAEGGSDSGLGGGGYLLLGAASGVNVSIDNNEIMCRNNGQAATLALNAEGGNVNLIQGGTGNVGIGTSQPQVKLQIDGGTETTLGGGGFLAVGSLGGLNVSLDGNEIMARSNGAPAPLLLNSEGGNVYLIPAGTGNVGIGTTSPANRLDVNGDARIRGGILFPSGVDPGAGQDDFLSFGNPGKSEDYIWYGENAFFFSDSPGGGDVLEPEVWARQFFEYSDERIKQDIRAVVGALDRVRRLRGIQYRFDGAKVDPKAEGLQRESRVHLGFAAQEVAAVVPEAVSYCQEADRYGVSYGSLVPLLVEAIKEQQAQIEQFQRQQAEIDQLKQQIARLMAERGS